MVQIYMLIDCSYVFDKVRNFYSYMSYFNPKGVVLPPLRYTLDLTYRCNLSCPYCFIGTEGREKNELSTKEWFAVIDQIPLFAIISMFGGEPLFREDFLEIYEKASKRTPYRVNVYSNGLLLNEKIAESFVKNKLLCLSVSLDGYKEKHDLNRKSKGAFDKIINNLDMLSQMAKNKHRIIIDIKTVLLENNLDDLIKLFEMCTKKKYDFFSISVKRNGDVRENPNLRKEWTEEFYKNVIRNDLYFDMEKFKDVYIELEKIAKNSNTKLRWSPKISPKSAVKSIEELFTRIEEPISELYTPCLYPFSNLSINPEGRVYPCIAYDMGSLRENSLSEIVNGEKFCAFRKNLKKHKVFNACQLCCELYYKSKR